MVFNSRQFCRCSWVCRNYSSDATRKASEHLIRRALTPKVYQSSESLANELVRTHAFHKQGEFVILNKPYGVSTLGYQQPTGGIFESSRYDQRKEVERGVDVEQKPAEPTVESALPFLRYNFREPGLHICTGLKRYLSGPIVLPCSSESANLMKESIKFATLSTVDSPSSFSHHRALVICVGRPKASSGVLAGYATFQTVGSRSEYIFVEGKAKRRAKSGKYAVSGSIEYDVLQTNYGCSLVDLKFDKFSRHLPRLAMSHLMAPILGDKIYLNRLAVVDGELHSVEPKYTKRNKHRQFVPKQLLERIDRTMPEYMAKIPMFFHVYQTVFPRFGTKKTKNVPDLVSMSLPSDNFSAMMEILSFSDTAAKHFAELTPEDGFDVIDSITSKEKRF